MRVAFVSFYNNSVPGVRFLAAWLERLGHQPRFIHFKALYLRLIPRHEQERIRQMRQTHPRIWQMSLEEGDCFLPDPVPITQREEELFLENISQDTPDVLGFHAQWNVMEQIERMAAQVREHFPETRLVAGGPSAMTTPEDLFPHLDAVCLDEGELPMEEWLENPDRTDVPGMWFCRNGVIHRNPIRPRLEDLDALPMPIYGQNEILIEKDQVSRKLETCREYLRDHWGFMSSRSCPNKCSYCLEGHYKRLFPKAGAPPRRSVDHFLAEIKQAVSRLPFERLNFWDSTFIRGEEWLEEFAEKYPREVGVPFMANGYTGISTRRMFDLLKEAGLQHAWLALQSGDDRVVREIYNRPTKLQESRKTIVDAQQANIKLVTCDIIVHSPFDSQDGLRRTFDVLVSLPRPAPLFLSHLYRLPGMPISEIPEPDDPLPEEVHYFWTVMFLLARFEGFSRKALTAISRDARLRQHPEILDGFLHVYVRRLKYLKRPLWMEVWGTDPDPAEVGSWPAVRLWLQERFPRTYARAKLVKRNLRKLLGKAKAGMAHPAKGQGTCT